MMMTISLALVLSSVFVIVFVCTVFALQQSPLRKMKTVLAFPVSMLSVLSLMRGATIVQENLVVDTVLIPYAALACALLFVLLLWLLSQVHLWIRKGLRDRHGRSEPDEVGCWRKTPPKKDKKRTKVKVKR